ncbi:MULTISPECIES: Hsp20/alpha crystallin family protein [Pseudofrankia]|uniref:Hsp20/alpha crystallin family protein n=1 Tax=Pseudofrankia TaxID=2994363 RepID=UPI000234BA30|nr:MULTISPECIES: Hsp20/alpha crystallin family protein [Pseudofrankia]OHV34352.1 heat-shock protein Hsp20 [Pseudofrankia sp. EUN1h]
MSAYLWDPFAVLGRLDREFEGVVRASFGPWDRARAPRATAALARPASGDGAAPARSARFGDVMPSADVVTDGDDVVVNVELPGVDVEKDVTVEIDRGRLVVRGERGDSSETSEGGRIRRERWRGSFRREFSLPESAAASRVSATYDRGVLSIRLPGAAARPVSTRIPVTAAAASSAELPVAGAAEGGPAQAGADGAASAQHAA